MGLLTIGFKESFAHGLNMTVMSHLPLTLDVELENDECEPPSQICMTEQEPITKN